MHTVRSNIVQISCNNSADTFTTFYKHCIHRPSTGTGETLMISIQEPENEN